VQGFFAGARPGRLVTHGSATFELPILYHRDDAFGLFFTADAAAVRALLPSPRLHPLALPGGRVLVGVMAFNYVDTSVGPYGEVAVAAPVVHGARPPLGPAAALLEARYPGFGNLVLHLPVTNRVARDAGRGQWGYTKFVADMRFRITPERMECELAEGGRDILSLRVERRGLATPDPNPLVTYSVRDGELIRTTIPQRATFRNAFRPRGSSLELGSHPVADEIRALDLGERPLLSRYYLERAAILPAGEVVERGVRPLEGFRGERDEAEHGVRYL
jgi:hypothetical protein